MGESILHLGIEKIPQTAEIRTLTSTGSLLTGRSIEEDVLSDLSEIITPRNTQLEKEKKILEAVRTFEKFVLDTV
jgi:hypothetical protein